MRPNLSAQDFGGNYRFPKRALKNLSPLSPFPLRHDLTCLEDGSVNGVRKTHAGIMKASRRFEQKKHKPRVGRSFSSVLCRTNFGIRVAVTRAK